MPASLNKTWRNAKSTVQPYFFKRTFNRSHPDPHEYAIAREARNNCSTLWNAVHTAVESVEYTTTNLPVLKKSIDNFARNSSNKEERERGGEQVLKQTRDIYKKNFSRGFDIEGFRSEIPFLWSFLGLLGGTGLGAGGMFAYKVAKEHYS